MGAGRPSPLASPVGLLILALRDRVTDVAGPQPSPVGSARVGTQLARPAVTGTAGDPSAGHRAANSALTILLLWAGFIGRHPYIFFCAFTAKVNGSQLTAVVNTFDD